MVLTTLKDFFKGQDLVLELRIDLGTLLGFD